MWDMDGQDIRVRRIAPEDAAELERFYAGLSADSRAQRFHGGSRGVSRDQAAGFAAADHRRRDGFVAVDSGRIVGHLVLEPLEPGVEELAVAVDNLHQHRGVGTLLLAAAFASARLRHVDRLVAWVAAANVPMRRLLTSSHHAARLAWDGLTARYELMVQHHA
jgi:L-amino acid N-acyltransferase YncA